MTSTWSGRTAILLSIIQCGTLPGLARFLASLPAQIGEVMALVSALILSRLKRLGDIELGLVIAFVLLVIATLPSPGRIYSALARASSEVSFTLYLTHFPLLTLIVLAAVPPARLAPGIG